MHNTFYSEILTEHNLHPTHKHELPDANYELEGVNPSCGDDIILKLRVDDGVVKDGAFVGDGCAISQASADMMLDLVIGRPIEEAKRLSEIFLRMIKGKITEEEKEELEEAGALEDISHMPARVKCAVLGWHTMDEIFEDPDKARKKADAQDSETDAGGCRNDAFGNYRKEKTAEMTKK